MKEAIAVASFLCAILFGCAALVIPPRGVIDSSVLVLIAQLLILCATFLGVESYVDIIRRKSNEQQK
jgi:hypothetical protein